MRDEARTASALAESELEDFSLSSRCCSQDGVELELERTMNVATSSNALAMISSAVRLVYIRPVNILPGPPIQRGPADGILAIADERYLKDTQVIQASAPSLPISLSFLQDL